MQIPQKADSSALFYLIKNCMEPFFAKKSLGQNFLKNPHIAEKIVVAGNVAEGDVVLEIGPGKGALTRVLLEHGAIVTAVEADMRALEVLQDTFPDEIKSGALTLIHADMREFDIDTLSLTQQPYKVLANIPYYLTGQLFRMFLSHTHQPSTLVFLVQKEVAERIARSKKESLLSLSVKVYGTPKLVQTVARGNFSPVPNVDSAILAIYDISREKFKGVSEEAFFACIHGGFQARRKQLFGALSKIYGKPCVASAFGALKLDTKLRGEDISVDTWLSLSSHINDCPHEHTVT